jgi:hypothetical protein
MLFDALLVMRCATSNQVADYLCAKFPQLRKENDFDGSHYKKIRYSVSGILSSRSYAKTFSKHVSAKRERERKRNFS